MDRKYRIGSKSFRHPLAAPNRNDTHLRRTGNLRAVQLLLGHTKIESTVRYLGIEVR
jgi:site-specific recombinase XerC